jgi:hypothetical protein
MIFKNEATFKYLGNMGNNQFYIYEEVRADYIQGMLAYGSVQDIRYFICYLKL